MEVLKSEQRCLKTSRSR